jgi:hypothetical protein
VRIVAFNGSPNGRRGNTHVMVREFLAGAESAGAEVEDVCLSEMTIQHCTGCFACWRSPSHECDIQDDMAPLLTTFMAADVAILASPVHVGGVTGLMKNFVDRMLPLAEPYMRMDERGVTRHPRRSEKSPDLVAISNCAFPDPACFTYFRSLFTFLSDAGDYRVLAEIFCTEGLLLGSPSPVLKATLLSYRELLRRAGREIVAGKSLSDETKAALARPFVPREQYIDMINAYWDRIRQRETS